MRATLQNVVVSLVLGAATGATAQADDALVNDDARAAFREAAQRYNAGEFERAAQLFERAYELTGRPNMLFNIAQAYRLAGPTQCHRAYAYYDRYLHEVPNAPNRSEVEERLAELAPCAPKRVEPTPQPPPAATEAAPPLTPTPPVATTTGSLRVVWPWPTKQLFMGSGVAIVLGALLVGGAELEMGESTRRGASPSSAPMANARIAEALGAVFLALGALAAATGVLSLRF